ncbi:MAG: tail fiber domain-containing protein [Chryseolinea sp.]
MKKTFLIIAVLFSISHALFSQWIPPLPLYYNTYYGAGAFNSNTTGNHNAAFGANALYKNTTTHYNTAIGAWALYNATATANVAVGRRAMFYTTTGGSNTAIGTNALENNTYGLANVAVGADALKYNVSGNWNTAVGYSSGPAFGNTTLIHATALGYAAVNTASFQVRIGNNLVTDIGGQVSWSTLSDGRFKRDIKEDIAGLDFINKLRPVSYTIDRAALARSENGSDSIGAQLKEARKSDARHTGFVAQEVEVVVKKGNYSFNGVKAPESDKDHYSIRYAEFVVPLVKAVQELTAILHQQQLEIDALQEKLDSSARGSESKNTFNGPALSQNFPNPFSLDTEIRMELPETTRQANVIIYNLEGKELKNISVNGHGKTSLKITRNDLNDGMYLYALVVDGKVVDTKRLILTK